MVLCVYHQEILIKADLHHKATLRNVKEGVTWWCAVGENVGVEINGKSSTFAVLAQARVLSVARLYKKIGMVPDSDLEIVKTGFHDLYC